MNDSLSKDKLIGYTLIFIGLFLIGYSVISISNVFTGKTSPYRLFEFDAISLTINPSSFMEGVPVGAETEDISQEIIPSEQINQFSNIAAHLLFMGFLSTAGLKIATIGTNLVRPIVIKSPSNKSPLMTSSTS